MAAWRIKEVTPHGGQIFTDGDTHGLRLIVWPDGAWSTYTHLSNDEIFILSTGKTHKSLPETSVRMAAC